MEDYKIISVKKNEAMAFMEKYEVMGNLGLGVWHYGLEVNSEILSIVSYGTPCFSLDRTLIGKIARQFNCRIIQLCRGGTKPNSPHNVPSKLISEANHSLYQRDGNLLIIAYADPEFGEVGAIYQAANAIYLGKTNPKGQSNYIIEGTWLSGWSVRKKYGTRNLQRLKEIDPLLKRFPLDPKFKYIFIKAPKPIKSKILKLLELYKYPYPKKDIAEIIRHQK